VLVLSTGNGGRVLGPLPRIARGAILSPFVRPRIRPVAAVPSRATLLELRALAESGALTPVIEASYSLTEVPEALRRFGTEHARAKLAIRLEEK
jgi:hypothetical protein